MSYWVSFLLIEALCLVGVLADYYLKLAGEGEAFFNPRPFVIGTVLYSSTAFGWFLIMKYIRLVEAGVIYSVSIVLLLTLLGVLRFEETLGAREIVGISLSVASLLVMSKVL